MRPVLGFLCGLIFGVGLVVSGMSDPAKVLNFLDVLGNWDPSLAFVMGGASAHGLRRLPGCLAARAPVLSERFDMPPAPPSTGRC